MTKSEFVIEYVFRWAMAVGGSGGLDSVGAGRQGVRVWDEVIAPLLGMGARVEADIDTEIKPGRAETTPEAVPGFSDTQMRYLRNLSERLGRVECDRIR